MEKRVLGLTRKALLKRIAAFHGYAAPGIVAGAFMVEAAREDLPEGTLFEAVSETAACLPDAVQLFTPCTVGNGWLRVEDLGRYALALYDKYTGRGFRASLDPAKLEAFPEYAAWFLKRKPKKEQDTGRLLDEIFLAGREVLTVSAVEVRSGLLGKRSKGAIAVCPGCGEAYPAMHGSLCLGCRGRSPYRTESAPARLAAVSVAQAVGRTTLHDMTRVEPGTSKEVAFARGRVISAGDVCELQRMGRSRVYVTGTGEPDGDFAHEDQAALALAERLCAGGGVEATGAPREGKITLRAARAGLLTVDVDRLCAVNALGEVALSTRRNGTVLAKGESLAGVRSIPLYLPGALLNRALALLDHGPVLDVLPLRRARAGALITGTEVFNGLVEDRFAPVLASKLEALGSRLERTVLAPDDVQAIEDGLKSLLESGCDLILTTAGMSVDPDDVTRLGLVRAGAQDILHGMPVLPGNMTLIARLGEAPVIGVPACALFHETTALDRVLPRVLAGIIPDRAELAGMGHGGFCLGCARCDFPRCPFGG